MAGRKVTFDTEKALDLFKKGFKYDYISQELSIKENTLKKFLTRHANDELKLRKDSRRKKRINKEEFTLESSHRLNVSDLKEIMDAKSHGINNDESMSTKSLLKCIWQSYITDNKTGRVKFDTSRGAKTKDVPPSYMPGVEYKNRYNCLIINSTGEKEIIKIRAYDNFDAIVEARRKANSNIAILKCEKML